MLTTYYFDEIQTGCVQGGNYFAFAMNRGIFADEPSSKTSKDPQNYGDTTGKVTE